MNCTNGRVSEAALTVEDLVELSWWGVDDKVGCYAYLHKKDGYRLKTR